MNTPDLQNLLQRCESDDATSAEIAALGALLQGQEQQEDWQGIRQGLQLGLSAEAEGFELAEDLARVVHPQAAWSAIASALRLGLPPAAGRADVARAVVHHVAPHAEAGLPRAVEALERGLAREARHGDVAQLVMARVLPGAEPELCAARAALRVGLRLEAAQADLADKIVAQALPERDQQLEQAAAALAWGLAAEAQDIDLSPAVMQLVLAEHSAWVQLSALADGELPVEQRRALAARLAQDASGRRLVNDLLEQGRTLRQALAHETAGVDLSAVWPAVAQQIGVAEQASWASLAQGLREEAGAIDVADAVMAAILPTPAAEPHEPSSSPAAPERQLELAPPPPPPPPPPPRKHPTPQTPPTHQSAPPPRPPRPTRPAHRRRRGRGSASWPPRPQPRPRPRGFPGSAGCPPWPCWAPRRPCCCCSTCRAPSPSIPRSRSWLWARCSPLPSWRLRSAP